MISTKASKMIKNFEYKIIYSTEGNAVEISDSDVVETLRRCSEKERLPVLLTPTPMVE
jgi:hypothetical protein